MVKNYGNFRRIRGVVVPAAKNREKYISLNDGIPRLNKWLIITLLNNSSVNQGGHDNGQAGQDTAAFQKPACLSERAA
jgi:hypothetical protein